MGVTKSLNSLADRIFTAYADLATKFTLLVALVGVIVAVGLSLGLLGVKVERRDADSLWIDLDSRLVDEKQQFEDAYGGLTRKLTSMITSSNKPAVLFSSNDTTTVTNNNALTALRDAMRVWENIRFEFAGANRTFNRTFSSKDVCERPEVPATFRRGSSSTLLYTRFSQCMGTDSTFLGLYSGVRQMYPLLDPTYQALPDGWGVDEFPCSRASALDCFREGNEVDWPEALQQVDRVSGALAQSLTTTNSQFLAGISAQTISFAGLTDIPVGVLLTSHSGRVLPCWFVNVTGNLMCLQAVGVDLSNQSEVTTSILASLDILTNPAGGILNDLDSSGLLRGAVVNALAPIMPNISMAGSVAESQVLARDARSRILGVFATAGATNALLGQVALFFSLRYRLQLDPTAGSTTIGAACLTSSISVLGPLPPSDRLAILGQLTQTIRIFAGLGFWWRPSYRTMSPSQIVEHFNLAANSQINPAVRSDPRACISGTARCCQAWNGAYLGTSIFLSGNARPNRRMVPGTGFSSLDLESITLVRAGWEDFNHNNPVWQDLLQARYPEIQWTTSKQREDFARAFDMQLTNAWLRVYNKENGTLFSATEQYSAYRLDFSTGNSLTEILEEASKVEGRLVALSYGVMAVLIILSLGNYVNALLSGSVAGAQLAMVNSHGLLGLVGLGVIALSSVAGLGFAAIVQITFNGLTINLVPFVSLGLGIDDMFVLAHTMYALNDRGKSVVENMRNVMCLAGPSVCLTSFANAVAFILVYYIPVAAIRQLVLVLMISVLINLVFLFLIFVPAMVWDMRRNHANRMDLIFIRASMVEKKAAEESNEEAQSLFGKFIENFYAPVLSHVVAKVVIIVLFTIWFVVLLWNGIVNTEQGLRTSDIALRDTYQRDTAELTENVITIQKSNLLTISRGRAFSDPVAQQQILDALSSLEQSPWIVDGTRVHDINWLANSSSSFLSFYSSVAPPPCPAANVTTPIASAQCYSLVYPSWQQVFGQFFYPYLYCRNANGTRVPCTDTSATLVIARTNYYFDHLLRHEDYLSATKDVRQRVDPHSNSDITTFSIGYVFYFWEQYIDVEITLIAAIGLGLLGVFVVTFLFQLNPWLSVIICTLILTIVVELVGLMQPMDVKLNAISVANLVISIGMSVEFTAHYARAFLLAPGSRNERMKVALHEMFQPMVNGAVSTIIAVSVLSLARFPFFRRYYALTYVVMVLVAFANGLILLPVVLSLIGPPPREGSESSGSYSPGSGEKETANGEQNGMQMSELSRNTSKKELVI